MHVLANDDDDGSNDASDLVEERSSLAQPMNSHEAVKNEKKKKRIFQTHFKSQILLIFFMSSFFTPAFKYDRLITYAFIVLQ